jgi:TPR repeat protein
MLPSQSPKIANAQPATAPVAKSPRATRVDDDVIASFISRAQVFLKSGDFAAARLLLRRAADAGSANAALMLGETFDPVVMSELGAIGIEPDVTQAREWYQKAVDLGSDVAAQRLGKLAQTR